MINTPFYPWIELYHAKSSNKLSEPAQKLLWHISNRNKSGNVTARLNDEISKTKDRSTLQPLLQVMHSQRTATAKEFVKHIHDKWNTIQQHENERQVEKDKVVKEAIVVHWSDLIQEKIDVIETIKKALPQVIPQNKIILNEQILNEGVYDPAIFKCIFVVGGPGSGKDFVLRQLTGGQHLRGGGVENLNNVGLGLKEINSDTAFEMLSSKHGINLNNPISTPQELNVRNAIRTQAKHVRDIKRNLALEGRLGVVINGTGDNVNDISAMKNGFEGLGYDTMMIYVYVENPVSRARNLSRKRLVPEPVRQEKWTSTDTNLETYANLFGSNFLFVNNTIDFFGVHPLVQKRLSNRWLTLYRKVVNWVRTPPHHPQALNWISRQLQLKNRLSEEQTLQEFKFHVPSHGLGIARHDLPQIRSDLRDDFLKWLRKSGTKWSRINVEAGKLTPSQGEFNVDSTMKLMHKFGEGGFTTNKPIIISNDNHIVDGHHRWLAAWNTNKNMKIDAIRVDMPIHDILEVIRNWDKVGFKDVHHVRTEDLDIRFEDFLLNEIAMEPADREEGTPSLVNTYKEMTPGQENADAPMAEALKGRRNPYVYKRKGFSHFKWPPRKKAVKTPFKFKATHYKLKSKHLYESPQFNATLNPAIWTPEHTLKEGIKEHLLGMAQVFIEFVKLPPDSIKDIIITGSNAGYNWTNVSDLDLHIIFDSTLYQDNLLTDYLKARKKVFSTTYDFKIHQINVEIYPQDISETIFASGTYSLFKDQWLKLPEKRKPRLDTQAVKAKVAEMQELIDQVQGEKESRLLLDRIANLRSAGLHIAGELSTENLVFKELRNNGYLKKLVDKINTTISKIYSMEQTDLKATKKKLKTITDYNSQLAGSSPGASGMSHDASISVNENDLVSAVPADTIAAPKTKRKKEAIRRSAVPANATGESQSIFKPQGMLPEV